MSKTASKTQILLARLTVLLLVGLIIVGLARYGVSAKELQRIWQNVPCSPWRPDDISLHSPACDGGDCRAARRHQGCPDGVVAVSLDAPHKFGGPRRSSPRRTDLHRPDHPVGLVMDSIYQFMVLKMFHLAESVIVALALAFLPYVLLRGPIARIARWWSSKAAMDNVR
jgi:hypothetical protein